MAKPRWIRSSRKTWERIGFLKVAAYLASQGKGSEDLVGQAKAHINSTINIPYTQKLGKWLGENGLVSAVELKNITTQETIGIRLQYWWAFNSNLATGWLSREAVQEYFEHFPRKIGILDTNFEISELGRLLMLGIISTDEIEALKGNLKSLPNPLELTRSQKVLFAYSILKADGDFILLLLERLAELYSSRPFTYLDNGTAIPVVLNNMATLFRSSAYTSDDQNEISEVMRLRDLITEQNESHIEKQGSGSRREQISIPRLEWLVDLGILKKMNARSYEFARDGLKLVKDWTSYYRAMLSKHYPEDCLNKLINEHFFGPLVEFLCGSSINLEQDEYLDLLKGAYEIVKGSMGYALIRSLLLFVNARQAENRLPGYVEYDKALESIQAEYKKDPVSTYYTVDRLGDEHQVKFVL
jgi:hypothetical protein